MNYKQTIEWMFRALPMYHRIGDAAIKKDLTNIRKLCDILDQPQHAFDSIHVAGTNGKGSTSHMLAAIFQAAGYKTGLYTSPHYVDFRERIKINGDMISEKAVIAFVRKHQGAWEAVQPSFFEITVAMAFDHFRREKVDIAIIETGLGGRLDSTNIIQPRMSVITNIGYDHMQMLGNTLPEIAFEKAGIIKYKTPVVIGEWKRETAAVFNEKAKAEHAPIHFASRHIRLKLLSSAVDRQKVAADIGGERWLPTLHCGLTGSYQLKNITTVLETIWRWNAYFPKEHISKSAIQKGIRDVVSMTNMMGRWMILGKTPLTITDAAHNVHGMKAMLPKLLSIQANQRHFVLGFVGDKKVDDILALFPKDGHYYWCAPDIPRQKPSTETQAAGNELGLVGKAFTSVKAAFRAAQRAAGDKDLIFIGGSSYVVGDLLSK